MGNLKERGKREVGRYKTRKRTRRTMGTWPGKRGGTSQIEDDEGTDTVHSLMKEGNIGKGDEARKDLVMMKNTYPDVDEIDHGVVTRWRTRIDTDLDGPAAVTVIRRTGGDVT